MKTGLGLNFLRIVNEEGFDGWSQVYARIPFEEEEIKKKGALFGVIFSDNLDDWTSKEAEIMGWVDEYFNGVLEDGDLNEIYEYLNQKYPGLCSVWVWVKIIEGGKRSIRLIKSGKSGIFLWRGVEKIDLGSQMLDGKVLKGEAKKNDRMIIWVGDLEKYVKEESEIDTQLTINKITDGLVENNKTSASLVFTFLEVAEDAHVDHVVNNDTLKQAEINKKNEEIAETIDMETKSELMEESVIVGKPEEIEEDMVSDRYIGPVGPKEKLINWWKNRKFKSRNEITVGGVVTKRKKMAIGMGVLFLILLIASTVSGSIKIKADAELKKWNKFYEPIEKKRQDALGLASVNLVGSRKLMEEVKTDFNAGKGIFVNTKFKNQLDELEKNINSSWTSASGEKTSVMENPVNIDLIRSGFNGSRISLIKESSFLVLDEKMGLVVSIDGKTKDIKVLAGKGEGLNWIDVVFDSKRNLLLDKNGITVVGKTGTIGTFDAAVSNPLSLGIFAGNLYLLDQGNKEIYRYNNSGDSLGDRNRWLKQDQSLSGTPVDMAIDGDIWVLEEKSVVEKFRRGSKENFSLNGVPQQGAYIKIAVEGVGTRIALLDTINSSVSIFKKEDGTFIQQLKYNSAVKASDIEFDSNGNLWVVAGGTAAILK